MTAPTRRYPRRACTVRGLAPKVASPDSSQSSSSDSSAQQVHQPAKRAVKPSQRRARATNSKLQTSLPSTTGEKRAPPVKRKCQERIESTGETSEDEAQHGKDETYRSNEDQPCTDSDNDIVPVEQPSPKRKKAHKSKPQNHRNKGPILPKAEDGLSAKQHQRLDGLFSQFDTHKNGRITMTDVLRLVEEVGLEYSPDEVNAMIRFWDTSGTGTVSRQAFTQISIESKFQKPTNK